MILKLAAILLMLRNYHCKENVIDAKNYEMKKVDGIEGRVVEIDFDVKNNTYLRRNSTHLYILDPKNEHLLYSKHEHVAKAIVTTDNFTYIVLSHRRFLQNDHTVHGIHRMRLNNMELQDSGARYYHMDIKKEYHDAYCIDSDNNLYFNGGPRSGYGYEHDWGLKLFKPDATDYSVVMTDVIRFNFEACEEDQNGTIYFINTDFKWGGLTFLTREERLNPSPKGKHILEINSKILYFKIWNNNKLYVEDDDGLISVRLLNIGELLPASYGTKYYFFNRKFNERFFIIEDRNNGRESYIHYITKESLTPVKIPKPLVPSIVKDNKRPIYVEDKHGTAYFAYLGSDEHQKLLVLKTTDRVWEERVEDDIYDLAVDNENIVWVLSEDGLTTPIVKNDYVEITTEDMDWEPDSESFLKVKKTNEIYIATKNGVFVVSKKQTQITTPSP